MQISKLLDWRTEAKLYATTHIALQEGVHEDDVQYLIEKVPAIGTQWHRLIEEYGEWKVKHGSQRVHRSPRELQEDS